MGRLANAPLTVEPEKSQWFYDGKNPHVVVEPQKEEDEINYLINNTTRINRLVHIYSVFISKCTSYL